MTLHYSRLEGLGVHERVLGDETTIQHVQVLNGQFSHSFSVSRLTWHLGICQMVVFTDLDADMPLLEEDDYYFHVRAKLKVDRPEIGVRLQPSYIPSHY